MSINDYKSPPSQQKKELREFLEILWSIAGYVPHAEIARFYTTVHPQFFTQQSTVLTLQCTLNCRQLTRYINLHNASSGGHKIFCLTEPGPKTGVWVNIVIPNTSIKKFTLDWLYDTTRIKHLLDPGYTINVTQFYEEIENIQKNMT